MCGIVGIVAEKVAKDDCTSFLIDGLKRLEYRGYDSAGLAVIQNAEIERVRSLGKVKNLENQLKSHQLAQAKIGIAHTRWATHGQPSVANAHPHQAGKLVIVHNGIIENYLALKEQLIDADYAEPFCSDTDTEVAAHYLNYLSKQHKDPIKAFEEARKVFVGAYAIALLSLDHPDTLYVMRSGSPLVIGLGEDKNYISSDSLSLGHLTDQFIYLEEGDSAKISAKKVEVYDRSGQVVEREIKQQNFQVDHADKGDYQHYMLKEIYEQPAVIQATIERLMPKGSTLAQSVSRQHAAIFAKTQRVQIVACGTSFHAGLVAREWFEQMAGIPASVAIASEYRYRPQIVDQNTLFVTISQSGETADTLAALQKAKTLDYVASIAICNVAQSTLVRESDLAFLTAAGIEVGVASTKAFTAQLVTLLQLVLALATYRGTPSLKGIDVELLFADLSNSIEKTLNHCAETVKQLASEFTDKSNCLFLGRGELLPIAQEGALKLKEISYIHAEAYPAGELKHGPLALVDENMPVVALLNHDQILFEKVLSNLNEVLTRGGQLYVVLDESLVPECKLDAKIITVPKIESELLAPLIYNIPLQLLAYYVAFERGEHIDQPRNLAKSVTVE